MKKIININLSGRLIPIEDAAYEVLKNYLDSLKRHFANEEGKDEILSDIESRIAELFQDKLKNSHCITEEAVNAVIASMGRPEQLDDDQILEGIPAGTAPNTMARPRKRLYRDPDDCILGGVCGGIGAYFNVDPIVFRLIFALLFFGAGTGLLLYIILWIAMPKAITAAEKLEMRGERVDLNNIKNAVKEEMNTVKSKIENVGQDMRNFSQGRGRDLARELGDFVRDLLEGLGRILVFIFKGFFYFLAAVILFAVVVAGIAIAASAAVVLPLKDLLLAGFWQNFLFWPAIIFLIGIPITALLVFLIRRLTQMNRSNRYVNQILISLWILGLVSAICLAISVGKDFKIAYRQETTSLLQQPSKGKLLIKKTESNIELDAVPLFDDVLSISEDTATINNVRLDIERSNSDSFSIQILKSAKGRTVSKAKELVETIEYRYIQDDSVLYLPSSFSIPRNSKFRDQKVLVRIRVPAGKKIEIDPSIARHIRWKKDWPIDWDYDNNDWEGGVNYEMTDHGLYRTDPPTNRTELQAPEQPAAPPAPAPRTRKHLHHVHREKNDTDSYGTESESSVGSEGLSLLFESLFALIKSAL